MGGVLKRLVVLAVVGFAVYRVLGKLGVIGGEDAVEFEWADDDVD